MPKIFLISVLLPLFAVVSAQAQTSDSNRIASVDALAAGLITAESDEAVHSLLEAARAAGLSDVQIATAFGLALETALQEALTESLPILMVGFEDFVADSSEPVEVITNGFEAGRELSRSRAEAGQARIAPEDPSIPAVRSPQAPLRSSPVGGGSSARGATGGGGGGVVSGGASPS